MKKKILINFAIICIIFGGAFNAYAQVSLFSCGRIQFPVYAADNTPIWEPVNQNDLATAFRYYCKSRNVIIDGSMADALATFTTRTFNSLCNTLGIDITLLQAELKKTYDNNLGQRFLFTHSGISLYNRIFAEFLQNNDLDVGDEVDNKVVYSGRYYTDSNGNSCLVYIASQDVTYSTGSVPSESGTLQPSYITTMGSTYLYDGDYFVNNPSLTYFNVPDISQNLSIYRSSSTNYYFNNKVVLYTRNDRFAVGGENYNIENPSNYTYSVWHGNVAIIYTKGDLYLGAYSYRVNKNNGNIMECYVAATDHKITSGESNNTDIYINTNNNTINNNTYNNNYTIIYNDGDYYEDDGDDEPDPSTPPGGGGGGGGDDPDPDEPDDPIVDPTPTPDPHIPDWDIELPEMPTGNEWLLYGMEKKFPWDIPYNLMFMLSLFAAEPETPHFVGTLDLKICQWNYDIDLEPFDNIARYVRDFEFIGFLIGLMLITRKLIWG